ncbi:MAG: TRAP transporter small permease [Deltaproteobacteria bacterium]|nr:TRAP transporter small permease [Deltaproteobacteria bacterium]
MQHGSRRARCIYELDRVGSYIEKGSGFFCVLFFAGMTFVVILGVFYRYVMKDPFQWTEEAARFLMLWLGFLAINIALRRNEHIAIDTVVKALPPTVSKPIDYLIHLLMGFFLVVLLVKACGMTFGTIMTAASMPISMLWIYLSVPLGILLTLIQLLLNITKKVLSEFDPVTSEIS